MSYQRFFSQGGIEVSAVQDASGVFISIKFQPYVQCLTQKTKQKYQFGKQGPGNVIFTLKKVKFGCTFQI